MTQNNDFNYLVNRICHANNLQSSRLVIEKELLHYDILFALSEHKLLDQLTFQGGTALRLCYQLRRFSEDLDFVSGQHIPYSTLTRMKSVIEEYLGRRYGFTVRVKEPRAAESSQKVTVSRWQITVITHPEQPDISSQKIRIEVANVPAYTRNLLPIKSNYDVLPDGYDDLFIHVESLEEILVDKIIAYVARSHVKARDLWDLQWLQRPRVKPKS